MSSSVSSVDFNQSDIVRRPVAFLDKQGEAILIRSLAEKESELLLSLYLQHVPRSCFNGLPPHPR
jgi:hypothetical protein